MVTPLREEPDSVFYADIFNEIKRIEAYPNPTNGKFTLEVELEIEGEVSIILYDLNGTNLGIKTFETELLNEEFDITNLPAAIYLLKVQVRDDVKVLKILKH
jgi:hypothetical protein